MKYTVKQTNRTVEIFKDTEKIGEYHRNYNELFNTFCPFIQGEKEYALYSPNYTVTRVMELPSCKDLCGEEPHGGGFCPTGYYVPYCDEPDAKDEDKLIGFDAGDGVYIGPNGQFGFVCGCYWGDDWSWKIQFLDLSKISEGKLIRDERFGYIPMMGDAVSLKDNIRVNEFTQKEYDEGTVLIEISCLKSFQLKGKKYD